jgi:sigma-B regulation protein RsbU (phosphoserine phosphatase)
MPRAINNSPKGQLESLKRAILLRKKGFFLLIASFNHDAYRDKLIEEINRIFTHSTALKITKDRFLQFVEFENYMASLSKEFSLIHVVNRGEKFYKDTWPVFYKGLNYHREKIAGESPVSIILWMRPGDVKDFALEAPDMWSWRSGVFDFELPEQKFETLKKNDINEKKYARIEEITNYLIDNPDLEENLKAALYQEMGELYYDLDDYKRAEELLVKTLGFYTKKGDSRKKDSLYKLLESIERVSDKDTIIPGKKNESYDEKRFHSLERELQIAADFQQSMLPHQFPPFPDCKEFDIYAKMIRARRLGGDFYDFFSLDEDRLAFAVGETSGSGIPAALKMVRVSTLLRTNAFKKIDPGECLQTLNDDLIRMPGDKSTFITLFYGVLNIKTGVVHYSNAGHPSPYIIKNNGKVKKMPDVGGTVVGLFEDINYEAAKIQLEKGDVIFVFTDGLIDNENPDGVMFGEDEMRLTGYLEDKNKLALKELIEGLTAEINEFAAGVPQVDDITMLALRFN